MNLYLKKFLYAVGAIMIYIGVLTPLGLNIMNPDMTDRRLLIEFGRYFIGAIVLLFLGLGLIVVSDYEVK